MIRSYSQPFLDSCRVCINQLVDQIRDLQITKGGLVIMLQAENDFGSYVAQRKDIPLADHKKYNSAIKQQLLDAGVEVPLFTSDGSWLFEGGSLEGVLPTANGEDNISNLKGIIYPVLIDSTEITGNWEMFGLPLEKAPELSAMKDEYLPGRATFFSGTFELKETGDTFLDMRSWGKGIVFVNRLHLGRYWSVGPQHTRYLPGCWLNKGKNEVVVFEQNPTKRMVNLSSIKTPILEDLKQ